MLLDTQRIRCSPAAMKGIAVALALGSVAAAAPQPERPSYVAVIGDSIVRQMQRQDYLPWPLRGARNLGVGGQTAAQIAERISSVKDIPVVVIEGGTNDLLGDRTRERIVPAYRTMLASLTHAESVVIVGVPPVDEVAMQQHWPDAGQLNNATIAEVNQQLVDLCAEFANCRPAVAAMQMDMRGKTLDGVHLPRATYLEWAQLVVAQLGR